MTGVREITLSAFIRHYIFVENHRTDTEYENALITKLFLFNFVNSYSSLFYIAFFKPQYGKQILGDENLTDLCTVDGSCVPDLMIQLAIILVGQQILGQMEQVFIPYVYAMLLDEFLYKFI